MNSQKSTPNSDEKKSKKLKWEALKEICSRSRDDGAQTKESRTKKPKISEEVSLKEFITNGMDNGVLYKKKNLKTCVSKDIPLSPIKLEEIKEEKDAETQNDNARAQPKEVPVSCKVRKGTMNLEDKEFEADIPSPQGASLMTVADIDLSPDDVEHALQFLEFCASFGKVSLTSVLLSIRPKYKSFESCKILWYLCFCYLYFRLNA